MERVTICCDDVGIELAVEQELADHLDVMAR